MLEQRIRALDAQGEIQRLLHLRDQGAKFWIEQEVARDMCPTKILMWVKEHSEVNRNE